jgi:hypothetical protein
MHAVFEKFLIKYLTDNGAADICQTHVQKMAEGLDKAVHDSFVHVPIDEYGSSTPDILSISSRVISGRIDFAPGEKERLLGGVTRLEVFLVPKEPQEEESKSVEP